MLVYESFAEHVDICLVIQLSCNFLFQVIELRHRGSPLAFSYFYDIESYSFLLYGREMKDLIDTKLYYINLDSRIDRRIQFESQEALHTMPPVQRIPAVHGMSIDIVNDTRVGLHSRIQLITEFRRSHYEIHSRGAVGASFSHYNTWKAFLKTDAKYALILEDDVKLPATFSMMVRDCAKDLPENWDIWILGWNHDTRDILEKRQSPFRKIIHFVGAHSYIVSRKAAKLLIKNMFPIETHIEHYMSNVAFINKFNIVRDIRLHIPQQNRTLTISDVRKADGCPTCKVDDRDEATNARIVNMVAK